MRKQTLVIEITAPKARVLPEKTLHTETKEDKQLERVSRFLRFARRFLWPLP